MATGTKTFNGLSTKTKAFLTETRPIYTVDKRDEGELIVEPGEIRFESVEAGVLYIMTFSIRNNTKVAQRIRIQPPHTGYFALNYIPSGSVAPGLDIRAEIECQLPTDNSDIVFTDKVIATMGSYRVEIPIYASRPYANIKFDRIFDCGNIVLHQPLTIDMLFENVGLLPGQLKLVTNGPDSYIKSMTPARFELDSKGSAKSSQIVKATIDAKEAGSWRELVRVSIAGTIDDALIEVHANFVEPKLTFLTENNQGLFETANFGTLFYGETKSVKGLLINAGPLPLNFTTVFEDDEETEGGEVPQTDEITAHYTKTLTISPVDGIVKPFSQIPITLTFKPKMFVPSKGFVRQHVDDNKAARQILRKVSIDCSDAEQRISVNMQGVAAAPMVSVSPSVLRFGDCPVNDRRDILINVSNKTKYPTDFEFPIIANFKFHPTKGHLHSLETVSVVASFLPPQLGKFKSNIKLSLAGGLSFFEVHAIGNSEDAGTRKTLLGGTNLLPADFEKHRKFVNPEEEAAARTEQVRALELAAVQQQNGLRNALKTKLAGTSYVALPIGTNAPAVKNPLNHTAPGDLGDVTAALAGMEVNGDPAAVPGEAGLPEDLMSRGSSHERDYMYGLTDQSVVRPLDPTHPMLQRREHNKAYNDFLQQSHAMRQKNALKQKLTQSLTKGAINFADPFGVNMGMERGLEEPVLKIPIAGEPLWLANGGGGEGAGPLRLPADENRLIVKKFQSTPATQAELRDCSTELSQENLKLVSASHKLIEFGRVSVGSTVAKNFSVANDLTQAVMVKIEELEAELQTSKPLCQVIPQGALAGFDIYFSSRHIGKIKKTFVWRLNGIHVSKVVVTAEVVPIELIMSTQELVMEFPPDSLAPTLSSNFVLQNPGNAPADFLWGSAGAFQCIPETGTINPGDSLVMTVTWSPLSGKRSEEELGLHITGGVDQSLKVQGILKETKAEFEQRRINLGVMAVGTEKVCTAALRNSGTAPLVFFLNPLDERLGIRASPHEAMILPGESATITVSVTPKSATTYDNVTISAKIRGGKPVSIKLTGSSIIPELTLVEPSFHFGSVTIGAEHRLPFTITNKTSILTTMVLDLTPYPDFTPCVRGGNVDEQEAQLASVIGTVNDDQEDSFGNQIVRVKEASNFSMMQDGSSLESVKIMRKLKPARKNTWNLLILPNATISGDLVFRPTVARQSNFKLPLYLQGIMEDKTYNRDVTSSAQTSTLNVSTYVVDFGDRVVSRDPCARISYFLETTIKNVANKRAVTFEIREMPEVIKEFGETPQPTKTDSSVLGMDDASKQIFFVAPTKGDLAPGSSMPIRVTFQPQSSANYSKKLEIYIKDQPDPSRPYLTLLCQGSGVFPRLTFSHQSVELPNVPLGITSRATFTLFNNGYNSLNIRHRVSPTIPVALDISYPDGQSVGIMVESIRVVIAAKSDTPLSWSGKIEFYDQDGERFFVNVSGCTDGCLLTNYPFVRDYASEYGFLGIDDQPVKYLRKSVIAELRHQEAKRKEELRRLRSLERKRAVEGKTAEEKDPKGKKRSGSPNKGSSLEEGSITSKTSKATKSNSSTTLQPPSTPAPVEHEGIDADRPPPSTHDDSELNFLMKWLNRNICRKPFEVDRFPDCVCDTNGEIVIDCIELMSGKKVPNIKPEESEGGRQGGRGSTDTRTRSSDATADLSIDRKKKGSEKANRLTAANRLVYKYQQLMNFLVNNGALLSHINPVALLGLEDHLLAQEYDLTRDKSQRFTPAMLSERRSNWQAQWLHNCKRTWLEVLYQSVKIFILARVHYKDFATMPGVVLTNNAMDLPSPPAAKTAKPGPGPPGKAEPKKKAPAYPKDLAPSNVFTHAEAVLLQWASYHLERASKLTDEGATGGADLSKMISFGKRVTDLDADFKDLIGYCQLIHSHVTDCTKHGRPLSGYTMMERGKGEEALPHFEEAMQELRMELSTTYEDITFSTRSILLMVLHMYLNLPNLVPKTKVEFVGDLGTPIMKEIELKNPSRRTIEYSVTLAGNNDFTAQSTSLVIAPESSAVFLVTLNAKFVDPAYAKLTFWAQKDSGLSGSTLCFDLVSRITGRRPTETIKRDTHLFELEQFQVTVKSPFPKDATYQISLHITAVPTTIDDHLKNLAIEASGKRVKPAKTTPKPVLPLLANVDLSVLSPAERKLREEESELELTFRQPFWCNEESVPISKVSARTITVYCLPFTMGKYTCQVVFSEKETGEFCKEIVATVGLPKVSDKLEFSALRDNYVSMALRIASKNATFEKAFAILGDMRIKNTAKKAKARTIFQSLISSQVVNEETGQSYFLIDFLSQFFEYTKSLPFVSEYMKFKSGDVVLDSTGNAAAKTGKTNPANQASKYKKMLRSLIEPVSEENAGTVDLNTSTLSFAPPKAGHYHSLAVVHSKDNPFDVRVIEVSANVAMPDAKMALEFNGPARQRLTQLIPVHNESAKDWNLQVTLQGKGFQCPKTLLVPAGQSANLEVTFFTSKAGKFAGQLLLRNTSGTESNDNFEYKLFGEAEDPLAEDDFKFEAVARNKKRLSIDLPASASAVVAPAAAPGAKKAILPGDTESADNTARIESRIFKVESDLPYVHFNPTYEVGGEEFHFTINSPIGGVFTGTINFTDEAGCLYWYTVSIEVAAPKEEKVIDVEATVRKAAVVEITLENPTMEDLVFDVNFQGDGLLGEDTIVLPASTSKKAADGTGVYELIYSPLLAGEFYGRISFTNDLVGVLWYKLNLVALPAEPIVLDTIESMIGSTESIAAPIDNPLSEPVTFTVTVSDPEHFSVASEKILLGPYAQSTFNITFRPSSLTEKAFGRVVLQNSKFGEIQFAVSGIGLLPGIMPTLHIDAPLNEIGSQTIVFRNPFPHPLPLDVILTHAETPTDPRSQRNKKAIDAKLEEMQTAFGLLLRKTSDVVIAAKASYHIALSFTPQKMGIYEAVVQVRSVVGGRSLLWCYPISGMAESGLPQRLPTLKTACKTTMIKEFNISLDGIRRADLGPHDELTLSDFSVEIKADESVKSMVLRAFRAQPLEIVPVTNTEEAAVNAEGEHYGREPADFALRLRMLFEPLRTFIANVDISLTCRNRGKWRIKLDLDATDPEPDDVIKLTAPVGGTDKVTFRLNNRFLGYSTFQAYYSAKSSPHFSVTPSTGTLAPYGAEGTPFVVTFAPIDYGTIEVGTLIIVTEDAQWSYEVRGAYPSNAINHANIKSKVDSFRPSPLYK
eukprot:gene7939-9469_t